MSNIATLNRSGRPPGAKNKSTLAKEALASAAVQALTEKLTPEEIAAMTPLQVLLACMAASFQAGDLAAARVAAAEAAPYCHSRVTPVAPVAELPPELQGDPPATPDEPGPVNPVL